MTRTHWGVSFFFNSACQFLQIAKKKKYEGNYPEDWFWRDECLLFMPLYLTGFVLSGRGFSLFSETQTCLGRVEALSERRFITVWWRNDTLRRPGPEDPSKWGTITAEFLLLSVWRLHTLTHYNSIPPYTSSWHGNTFNNQNRVVCLSLFRFLFIKFKQNISKMDGWMDGGAHHLLKMYIFIHFTVNINTTFW